MATLILIKHALPEIEPAQPNKMWQLGATGRQQCDWLAEALLPFAPQRLVSSHHAKALQTAEQLAPVLKLEPESYAGLEENDRTDFPFLPKEAFQQRLREFLEQPDTLLIGTETARQAQQRFANAIGSVWDNTQNLVVVAHGTVNTLFTALHNTIDAYRLWAALTCPSFIVLEGAALTWDGVIYHHPAS